MCWAERQRSTDLFQQKIQECLLEEGNRFGFILPSLSVTSGGHFWWEHGHDKTSAVMAEITVACCGLAYEYLINNLVRMGLASTYFLTYSHSKLHFWVYLSASLTALPQKSPTCCCCPPKSPQGSQCHTKCSLLDGSLLKFVARCLTITVSAIQLPRVAVKSHGGEEWTKTGVTVL